MTIALIDRYRSRLPVSRRDSGDLPGGGLDAAAPGAAALGATRGRALAQVGGVEPDRLLQGPRHDGRRLEGRRGRRRGRDLRLDRQHRRLGGGVRGPGRAPRRRADARGRGRGPQGRADPDAGREGARGARRLRPRPRRRAGARRPGHARPRQLDQPEPPRRAEDRGVRDRGGARRRAGRVRHPLRGRRQHVGLRGRHLRARALDADLLGRGGAPADTMASAIRIGDPVHAASVRDSGATVVTVSDDEIVAAWLELASLEGLFCEPSSAAGLAAIRRGDVPGGGSPSRSPGTASRTARAPTGTRRHSRRSTPIPDAIAAAARLMKLRAPATSANIGAGFDTAAVALDLWNDLEVTDGTGVVVEGEGASELAADETNLAVRAYALLADPSGQAVLVPEPDPTGTRPRLVRRGDRARPRRGRAGRERGGAARRRPHAGAPRRQPRGGAARGAHAVVGREDRADRRAAAARADRGDPERPDVDGGLPPDAADHRAARGGGRKRRARRAPRRRRGERRRRRSSPPR